MNAPKPFAACGSEKMIYDIRMGPQCIHADGEYYAACQANPAGGRALPQIVKRNRDGAWSAPVILGDVSGYDHHFAPVIWFDAARRLHALYHCHITLNESRHLIAQQPESISAWSPGPPVAPSISYPTLLPLPDGRLMLYHRPLGHMGFWTYQLSEDGGLTWRDRETALVDFDYLPGVPGDDWAGSYHSVALGCDGKTLHVAFVYWDERDWPNPRYGRHVGHRNRYNLYYLRVDIATGRSVDIAGRELPQPLNRAAASACLVWETESEHTLTNMPSILIDADDRPSFLMPVSGETTEDCRFWFIRREGESWERFPVADANSTWNGSHMEYGEDGSITAFLIATPASFGDLNYGGGDLQEWRSVDGGTSWEKIAGISPGAGMLCNNPRPVLDITGRQMKRTLIFYAWDGPGGILRNEPFRGKAYLWQNDQWL